MIYRWHANSDTCPYTPGKIICVGRNYSEHAQELHNPVPESPILFIKPASSLVAFAPPSIALPSHLGNIHYEAELALLVTRPIALLSPDPMAGIGAYGLALDLTLRELQQQLKTKGHPWECAKAFDHSCAVTPWLPLLPHTNLNTLSFTLTINQQLKQQGCPEQMIFPLTHLLGHITRYFSLQAGDMILTGTPAGVGLLCLQDQLCLSLSNSHGTLAQWHTQVTAG